jgi:predicted nucleotidyltransferase
MNAPVNPKFTTANTRLIFTLHASIMSRVTSAREIKDYVAEVVREFKPEKIILFGSHAVGNVTDHSDVDLLIVMQFDGRPSQQALAIRQQVRKSFPLDLIVQTPAQSRSRLREGDSLAADAFATGRVLYEKS